jgi:molybdenum cofactor cytidylyltransferase
MRLYTIIPAAGKSKRMGINKYLLSINNKSMIRMVIDNLLDADLENIYLVLSENSPIYNEVADYQKINILINNLEPSEMADSIRIALKNINMTDEDGVLITPADMPFINKDTLKLLTKYFVLHKNHITIPIYKGRKGHPIIIPSKIIYELFFANTLRDVIKNNESSIFYVEVNDKAILMDIDTVEDYKNIQKQ